jgi:hypothetical protein
VTRVARRAAVPVARRTLSGVAADAPTRQSPAYAERLTVPWWLWVIGLACGALLATEVWLGGSGLRAWLPYAVLLPLSAAVLAWAGRIRVAVTTDEFQVDDARLPVRFVADVVALDSEGRREVLGVGAHALAFVVQRPWVGGAVQVLLDDPADPTPYWVVSTRHPVRLATALLAARDQAGG